MYKRLIYDQLAKTKKSFLLLGPRQTGKSTLLNELDFDLKVNLSLEAEYIRYLRQPDLLVQQITSKKPACKKVLIDEVQRIPSILNTVQVLIDEYGCQFYLTGSSARKLKRGNANLLPGRIHQYSLGPLTFLELGEDFELDKALIRGTLPGIWCEGQDDAEKTLDAYASTYLKEEIQAEALTKNLEGFSRYLFNLASWAGKFVDYSKLASEAAIERTSSSRYFEILEDTLLIHRVEPFSLKSQRGGVRRVVKHPKFYFFDSGVLNALLQNFVADVSRKGLLFEHFIINQLLSLGKGLDVMSKLKVSSYRTEHGAEVDFIVELQNKIYAIEIKCSKNVGGNDLRGLRSFAEFMKKGKVAKRIFCLDPISRKIDDVEILHWRDGLREVFSL